eukprot:tig00001355_g8347.t1
MTSIHALRSKTTQKLDEFKSWFTGEMAKLQQALAHGDISSQDEFERLKKEFAHPDPSLLYPPEEPKPQTAVPGGLGGLLSFGEESTAALRRLNITEHIAEVEQAEAVFVVDLVQVLAAAAVGGLVAVHFGQPALVGYLWSGVAIGPGGYGIIKAHAQVESLAQFGVAFLLFAIGVDFSLRDIRRVGSVAIGGGLLQMAVTTLLTLALATLGGLVGTGREGLALGACLSLSSTAVVVKCLMERGAVGSVHGRVMLGMLVVQDFSVGLVLAAFPALAAHGDVLPALLRELYTFALFAAAAAAAGSLLIPRLLRFVARSQDRSQELFLLVVVVLCLGVALVTEHLGLGVEMVPAPRQPVPAPPPPLIPCASPSQGAFVAGLCIHSEAASDTLRQIAPLRDIFGSMFFVCIGMLIDVRFLYAHKGLLLLLVFSVLCSKILVAFFIVKIFGYSRRHAVAVSIAIAQVGEFSFVLASRGVRLGLMSRNVYLLLAGTAALTLCVTPLAFRHIVGRLVGEKEHPPPPGRGPLLPVARPHAP